MGDSKASRRAPFVRFRLLFAASLAVAALVAGAVGVPATAVHATVTSSYVTPTAGLHGLPAHGPQLVMSADGSHLYTTSASGSILVIDTATRTVASTITTATPVDRLTLASDGTLYAEAGSTIYHVDPSTGTTLAAIELPASLRGGRFAIAPNGTRAIVLGANTYTPPSTSTPSTSSYEVGVVDLTSDELTSEQTDSGRHAQRGLAFSPDSSTVWVADTLNISDTPISSRDPSTYDGTLDEIDATTGAQITRTPVGVYPDGVAVSSDGSRVLETNGDSSSIDVIDTHSGTVIKTASVPGILEGATLSADGRYFLVDDGADGNDVAVDTATLAMTTLPAGSFLGDADYDITSQAVPGTSRFYIFGLYGRVALVDAATATLVSSSTVETAPEAGATQGWGPGETGSSAVVSPDGNFVYYLTGVPVDGMPASLAVYDLRVRDNLFITERLTASDRYGTADVAADQTAWHPVYVLYVTNGTEYQDSLSALDAANVAHGNLLLTPASSLPSSVAKEAAYLQPKKVVIVGSTSAVSAHVAAQLRSIVGPKVPIVREQGTDRYVTSRTVVAGQFGTKLHNVWIATGSNSGDAMAAVAAASWKREPLLLVNGSEKTLDAATTAFLKKEGATSFTMVGPTSSVSAGVQASLATLGSTVRLAGTSTADTSRVVTERVFPKYTYASVAADDNWTDEVAAAEVTNQVHSPMLLVPSTCIPSQTLEDLTKQQGRLDVTFAGGPLSLTPNAAALGVC